MNVVLNLKYYLMYLFIILCQSIAFSFRVSLVNEFIKNPSVICTLDQRWHINMCQRCFLLVNYSQLDSTIRFSFFINNSYYLLSATIDNIMDVGEHG